MKNFSLPIIFLFFSICAGAQIINIPDTSFKALLLSASNVSDIAKNSLGQDIKIDANNNGEIEQNEVLGVAELNIYAYILINPGHIVSLEGIQYFSNLKKLNCWGNQITSIDLTGLNSLEELKCFNNQITSINFASANQLKVVSCYNNLLTHLDTSNLGNVESLFVHDNNLSNLDFTHLGNLQSLNIRNDNFGTLDVTSLSNLKYLVCSNSHLTSLLIHDITSLREIVCDGNQLTSLNLNGLSNVYYMAADGNAISSLNVLPLTSITQLSLMGNPLTSLNVSGLTTLGLLFVSDTSITAIDCSQTGVARLYAANCPNLQTVNVRNGVYSYSDPDLLDFAFRIYNNPSLVSICTDDGEQNQLGYFNYNTSGSVVVYNGVNCDIPVQVNMGVDDFNEQHIKVYPNPTSGIVNIEVSNNQPISKATIVNLLGQAIMSFENKTSLDLSELTKGTYFITIETTLGKQTQKIIKL
ncbi:MAG TPA: T9SS type A sorting domain-containing protein [Flavobacterium sp.]|uniref:leucine-rich repeat domain-containing protein n=1 Tax=Flavobacterium sp. TaxID=239 RepID=UPI002CE6AD59|nr:leucine-rich repeat domain-containing protein [Flavobacterium sp.]HNP33245.1 T9SS type A sorting domain-containing protein [Flavobacterium sp.]